MAEVREAAALSPYRQPAPPTPPSETARSLSDARDQFELASCALHRAVKAAEQDARAWREARRLLAGWLLSTRSLVETNGWLTDHELGRVEQLVRDTQALLGVEGGAR
jgi:hypothetical protein